MKLILYFALPLFWGRLFQLLYSLVDTRIVGQILGEHSLAAVGATTSLSDLLVSILNGFTNGTAIIVATFFGSGNEKDMKKAVAGTFLLGIGLSVIISMTCLCFLNPILTLLNISEDILPESKSYISIILIGLLTATLYNICAAVLRAVGDSFTPLLFLIMASVLNVGLDYLFILQGQMGVAGAAWATVISQAVSAVLCFGYMYRKYPQLRLRREDMKIAVEVYRKMISAGASMAFMVSFVSLGTFSLQTAINTFGTNIIVAHSAARKVTSMFMLPSSVLSSTLATFCGQNLGAGKYSRIKEGIRNTVLLTWGWCIVVIVLANNLSPHLIRAITSTTEQEILDTASLYLRVNTAFYFVPSVIGLFRNSMQGFGDNRTPVFSSSLELVGKVLVAFFLAPQIGYWGIIVAEPIVWFIMVIPLIVNMVRNPIFKMQDKQEI